MRSRYKVIVAALCTLALAVMPMFAAWGDTSSGTMTATEQTYKNYGNDVQRIDTFKLDNLYSYKSLGGDSNDTKPTLTLSKSTLQNIVKNKLLPQWSGLAASVFRDQAGQLVDLYGEQPSGGNMSQAGFDSYFNMSGSGKTQYKDEKWSCYNLASKLGQTSATHAGDPGWDQFIVTGVKQVSSLNGARTMMAQSLRDSEKTNAVSTQEFLDADEGGNTRLEGLDSDDQTTGFVNVVTAVNCKGSSADFDYASFGIVFYDFEPVPVAAQGLAYVNAGLIIDDPDAVDLQSVDVRNGQQHEVAQSALVGDSVTETTSTTLSGLASFEMSQNIGADIGWSNTESSSETSFWADDDFGVGSSTSTSSETMSMGLNWGAAWKMAGSLGAEAGHSQSKEVSKAVDTTIVVPAHTSTSIKHTQKTTTYTQTYQQPVILSYKVAIFAMSGDFYSSSAFGGIGGINASNYDKQSLVIKFDTQDEDTPFYGCTATDDLYSRIITNNNVSDYDASGDHTYTSHSTARGWSKSEDINWDAVRQNAQQYYDKNVANEVAKQNYFFETPGKLDAVREKSTSEVQPFAPLHDLDYVTIPKDYYVLYPGDTIDSSALSVQGYNKYKVPYYGFNSEWGEWVLCDENGNELTDATTLQDVEKILKYENGVLKPVNGTTGGKVNLKWVIERSNNLPDGVALTKDRIESDVVTIDVPNQGLINPKMMAEGSYVGFYRNSINLNDVMTCLATDSTEREIEVDIKWESQRLAANGIILNEGTGKVTFKKPGFYRVRPFINDVDGKRVYPMNGEDYAWLLLVATEHNLVHYNAKAPIPCETQGWIEHYRCSDCGKYYSDAAGENEISAKDVFIDISHNWGDWTTVSEPKGTTAGKQERVCKNDEAHKQTRKLFAVQFNMNGHGTAPEKQTVIEKAKAAAPKEPTAEGYTFEGWFTDSGCNNAYDFNQTVTANTTLYAKWLPVKHMVAVMAVGDVYEAPKDDGTMEWTAESAPEGVAIVFDNQEGVTSITEGVGEDQYTYYYKEVEYGTPVVLNVSPTLEYGLKGIEATPIMSDSSMGDSFTPSKSKNNDKQYSLVMPDADVAVVASFAQVKVTYDSGNVPAGATVKNMPENETIAYGSTPANLNQSPTLENGQDYRFDGWFTDQACTKPCLPSSSIKGDTTLYAKWTSPRDEKRTVTYTLYYYEDNGQLAHYDESYQVVKGSCAYDPTKDLYAVAGRDLRAAYELYSDGGASCWFTSDDINNLGHSFDFNTPINDDTHLYASVVLRKHTVTFYNDFNGSPALGSVEVYYNNAIESLPAGVQPHKEDSSGVAYQYAGWITADGMPWSITNNPVTSDLSLYPNWPVSRHSVIFNANGYGEAPAKQIVEDGKLATDPGAIEAEGYAFVGWFTDKAGAKTKAYDFKTPVTADITLYAKETVAQHTVTFDSNGHGSSYPAKKVNHGAKVSNPGRLAADGYTFGGWFTDQAGTKGKAYNFDTPVTSDIRLYAKWTKLTTPDKVAITSVSSPLKNKVVVKWGAANDADGYEVATGGIITNVAANKHSASIVNTALKAGNEYDVMVRAWHMNGSTKTYGSWSSAKKVTISKYYNAKTKKKVKTYKKANINSKKKATLKKGTTVKVLKTQGKWVKTNKGWILKKNLKAVKIVNKVTTAALATNQAAPFTSSDSASSLTAARIG